jgi:AraC-like DNA-binding protein
MRDMISVLSAVGASLCSFLLIVLAAKRPLRAPDRWLCGWLVAQAVFFASVAASSLFPSEVALPILMAGQLAIVAALGPLPFLYAASALGTERHYPWHAAMLLWSSLALGALAFFTPVQARGGALVLEQATPWLALFPLSALLLIAIYPWAILRLVDRRRRQLKDQFSDISNTDPGWMRMWAVTTLVLLGAFVLARASAASASWSPELQVTVQLLLMVASVAFVGHRGLTRPGIFLGWAELRGKPVLKRKTDPNLAGEDYARVQQLLAEEKPHLHAGLTAQMLADQLGWAPERLTAAFRVGGAVNFFDAINAARVREVQSLAGDPANRRTSLLAMSQDAGFGSKTSFYEAFHRHVGCAPATWRRHHVRSQSSE